MFSLFPLWSLVHYCQKSAADPEISRGSGCGTGSMSVQVRRSSHAMMNGSSAIPVITNCVAYQGRTDVYDVGDFIIIALAFGGALEKTGCLETIVRELLGRLQGRAQLITGALLTTFGFNLASNAFVAYTIRVVFADAFAAESLAPAALSGSWRMVRP